MNEHDWSNKIDRYIKKILIMFIYLFSAALIFTVLLQVLDRYVYVPFRTIWTSELARYLFVWVSVIGAAASLQENRLIKVDLFVDRLPFAFRKICEIISLLIVIFVSIFLITSLTGLLPRVAKQLATATRLPMSYVYSAGVFAGVMFILFSLTRVSRWIRYKDISSIQENDE